MQTHSGGDGRGKAHVGGTRLKDARPVRLRAAREREPHGGKQGASGFVNAAGGKAYRRDGGLPIRCLMLADGGLLWQ